MKINEKLYNKKKQEILSIKQRKLCFVIEGDLLHYERNRTTGRGRFVRQYDPTAKDKKIIQKELSVFLENKFGGNYNLIKTSMRIEMIFCKRVNKGWSNVDKKLAIDGLIHPYTKADIDNHCKIYMDIFNKFIYTDDATIYELRGIKRFISRNKNEKVIVKIWYDSDFRSSQQRRDSIK